MHDITFAEGRISMLVSQAELFQFYYQNKIPTLCTDRTGRTLPDGIYLNKILQQNNPDCAVLIPLMQKIGKKFGVNYGQNSLTVMVHEKECQHLYSFYFDLNEKDFLHWVINNGHLLQDVIDDYNWNAREVISEAKAAENQIVLPFFNDSHHTSEKNQISLIHKNMNIPIHLSPQQSKCLLLLMKGKSAKQIAREIKLSHRTVEHYLERIRKLLDCSSNRELMAAYGDQLIGFTPEF